jgi:hypothetical protein
MRTQAPITLPMTTLAVHMIGNSQPNSPVTRYVRTTTKNPTTNPPFREALERLIFRTASTMALTHCVPAGDRATPAFGSSEVAMILRCFCLT